MRRGGVPLACAAGMLVAALALAGCTGPAGTPAPTAAPAPRPVSTPAPHPSATPPTPPTSPSSGTRTPGQPTRVAPSSAAPTQSAPSVVPAPNTPTTPTTRAPRSTPTRPAPTASCTLPVALRGTDVTTIPTTRRVMALTFDGGSGNQTTDRILATLDAKDAPATFFLTGDFADAFPGTARRIASRHPVGNHTQDHPDLTKLPDAAVRAQLDLGREAIRTATGVDPRPYFRFPYGAVDAHRIALVNDACYVPFRWTTDTLGWQGTSGGRSAASVTRRVLDQATPGGIVLMHLGAHPDDGSTLDADALPGIIDGLRAQGYTLVTLEAVLPAAP